MPLIETDDTMKTIFLLFAMAGTAFAQNAPTLPSNFNISFLTGPEFIAISQQPGTKCKPGVAIRADFENAIGKSDSAPFVLITGHAAPAFNGLYHVDLRTVTTHPDGRRSVLVNATCAT